MPGQPGPATRPCTDPAGMNVGQTFELRVTNTAWQGSLVPPYLRAVPNAQPVEAAANFLVLDLELVNTTNQPRNWALGMMGNFLKLRNAAGTTYFPQAQLSVLGGTAGGLGSLNPGIPVEGTVVFDVPRGDYDLVVMDQRLAARSSVTNFFAQQDVAACRL